MTEQKTSRNSGLDLIRCVACFMVVALHVAASFWYGYGTEWIASNVFDSLVRSAVPLFFMLSGALLLKKSTSDNLDIFLKHRMFRIFPPLLFWGGLSAIYASVKHRNLLVFFKRLIGVGFYHLWYLYALIGLYLLLPLIGKWYVNANKRERLFYLSIWFLACCISVLNSLANRFMLKAYDFLKIYSLGEFASYIGFFVLGAYLLDESKLKKSKNQNRMCLYIFLLGGIITAFLTFFISKRSGQPIGLFYQYRSPVVIVSATALFKYLLTFQNIKKRYFRLILFLARHSLGIYCLHAYVLSLIPYYKVNDFLGGNTWITIPLLTIFVFLVSLAIACVMKKIPFFEKVV